MAEKSSSDRIARGSYTPSHAGSTIFVGLRTLDIFIQHRILAQGLAGPLLSLLHITPTPSPLPTVALGLPLPHLLILAMATGSALKQIYWQLRVSNETFPPDLAVMVAVFNTVFNSTNSILALTAASSFLLPSALTTAISPSLPLSPVFMAGATAYVIGILTETIAEIQRRDFKADERNKGKAFTGGLFGLARHVNYGGYTIWRAGYAAAAGGILPGVLVAGVFLADFATRGVPLLDEYCSKRYGAQWVEFKKKVPYKLIPGLY